MKLIVVLDDDNGMMFNHRRQSQDSQLRAHILEMAKGTALWMNGYTQKQFSALPENVHISESPMDEAGQGEYCFIEDMDAAPFADQMEELILFRWNRRYPADLHFNIELSGWKLKEMSEFEGTSHQKITKEVYER